MISCTKRDANSVRSKISRGSTSSKLFTVQGGPPPFSLHPGSKITQNDFDVWVETFSSTPVCMYFQFVFKTKTTLRKSALKLARRSLKINLRPINILSTNVYDTGRPVRDFIVLICYGQKMRRWPINLCRSSSFVVRTNCWPIAYILWYQ